MKEIIQGSRIIGFCKELNKKLLEFFFSSTTYRLFLALNRFFKNSILKNRDESIFIKAAGNLKRNITESDAGLFIVLIVCFNTLAMFILKREIDIFSSVARAFFFVLGVFFIFRKSRH